MGLPKTVFMYGATLAALLVGATILFGCRAEIKDVGTTDNDDILFINEVEQTDVWILPDTEANRDLPYSTPTIDELEENGQSRLSLQELGGPGMYVVHMFAAEGMYYGVYEVPLEAGYTLRFRRQDWGWMLDITDKHGKDVASLEVFGAMWAGDGGGDELDD